MSVINLDNFKNFDNVGEAKLPNVDKTWKVKFNDDFRLKASLIAAEVQKLFQEQSDPDYQDEILDMAPAERKKALTSDLKKIKKATIEGVNDLLDDPEAGEEVYKAYGESTEAVAYLIGSLNDSADKALDLDKEEESKEKMSKYDAER